MQRNLATYPISVRFLTVLRQKGIVTVEQLRSYSPVKLSQDTGICQDECLEILRTVGELPDSRSVDMENAYDILKRESNMCHIITFCQAVDSMLGGGIPLGMITEICGTPGIGKTQLCLQLAVDVQIPSELGGNQGECLFIDTEGSFTIERLEEIAEATVQHCDSLKLLKENEDLNIPDFTVDTVLKRIHCLRCHSYIELLAVIETLAIFLSDHPKVG